MAGRYHSEHGNYKTFSPTESCMDRTITEWWQPGSSRAHIQKTTLLCVPSKWKSSCCLRPESILLEVRRTSVLIIWLAAYWVQKANEERNVRSSRKEGTVSYKKTQRERSKRHRRYTENRAKMTFSKEQQPPRPQCREGLTGTAGVDSYIKIHFQKCLHFTVEKKQSCSTFLKYLLPVTKC